MSLGQTELLLPYDELILRAYSCCFSKIPNKNHYCDSCYGTKRVCDMWIQKLWVAWSIATIDFYNGDKRRQHRLRAPIVSQCQY
jgi:hypothetical protein